MVIVIDDGDPPTAASNRETRGLNGAPDWVAVATSLQDSDPPEHDSVPEVLADPLASSAQANTYNLEFAEGVNDAEVTEDTAEPPYPT
jgi:hypothetical protein